MNTIKAHLLREAKREYAKVVLSLLEIDKDAKLLDLGSGDVELTKELASRIGAKDVYGLDLAPKKIDGMTIIACDLNEGFPLGSEMFDVVVASQIIEHLSETDNFLREICRVLRPNGYAIVSTPNLASWHNIIHLLFGIQPLTCSVSDEMGWPVRSPAHRRVFTVSELTKLLKYHKFKVQQIICSGYYPLPIPLARVMCKIDRGHSVIMTVKMRKET